MKILFVCLEAFPDGGACAVILRKLFAQNTLQNIGQVHVLAIKMGERERNLEEYDKIVVHRFNSMTFLTTKNILMHVSTNPLSSFYAIAERIWHRLFTLLKCNRSFLRRSLVYETQKALEKLKYEQYDIIIPVSGYYEATCASLKYAKKNKIPMILYQVDPCSTNCVYSPESYRNRFDFEQRVYQYCSYVITTPIIAKEMAGLLKKPDVAKMVPMMFPNVEPIHSKGQDIALSKKQILCVFTGRIYRGARDPQFTLRLFSALHTDAIKLKLIGVDQADLARYVDTTSLPSSIECCGSLPFKEAQAAIEDADFLVNIGNVVINQLPSKLFEYISSGKPIINICTSRECPSIPYMKRYQLAINLFANDEDVAKQVQALKRFVLENTGKRLSPEEIIHEFPECTAAHCAKSMAQVIQAIIR